MIHISLEAKMGAIVTDILMKNLLCGFFAEMGNAMLILDQKWEITVNIRIIYINIPIVTFNNVYH